MNNQTSLGLNSPTPTLGAGVSLLSLSVLSLRRIQRGGWVESNFKGKMLGSPLSPGGDQGPRMADPFLLRPRCASASRGVRWTQLWFSAAWHRPQPRPRAPGARLGQPAVNGVPSGRAGEQACGAAGKGGRVSMGPGSAQLERATT